MGLRVMKNQCLFKVYPYLPPTFPLTFPVDILRLGINFPTFQLEEQCWRLSSVCPESVWMSIHAWHNKPTTEETCTYIIDNHLISGLSVNTLFKIQLLIFQVYKAARDMFSSLVFSILIHSCCRNISLG